MVARDDEGRLHGTVEPEAAGTSPVDFSGVIQLVATIEASIDHTAPDAEHGPTDAR